MTAVFPWVSPLLQGTSRIGVVLNFMLVLLEFCGDKSFCRNSVLGSLEFQGFLRMTVHGIFRWSFLGINSTTKRGWWGPWNIVLGFRINPACR